MQASRVLVATLSIFGFQKSSLMITFEKLTGLMWTLACCAFPQKETSTNNTVVKILMVDIIMIFMF
jgi:hypothetical protein